MSLRSASTLRRLAPLRHGSHGKTSKTLPCVSALVSRRVPTLAPRASVHRAFSSWTAFKDSVKMKLGVPGKKLVGTDVRGNTYYITKEHADDIPRRVVDYVDEFPDSNNIPRLWYSWLRHTIQHPPTEKECLADLQEIEDMKEKVRLINLKDEKLRMQEMAERRASGETEAPDMSVKEMIGQLEKAK